MSTFSFKIKKWGVRIFVALSAMLAFSSCHSAKNAVNNDPTNTDDPGRGYYNTDEPTKTVYGPPPARFQDSQHEPVIIDSEE